MRNGKGHDALGRNAQDAQGREGAALAPLITASFTRCRRESAQAEAIARLEREVPVPQYRMSTLFTPDFRRGEVELLSDIWDSTP